MDSMTEKTWMLFNSISNSKDNAEKLALLGQLHDALRREPANIETLIPQIFSIRPGLDDECKVALCRMIDEIAGRGMVPEDARTEVFSLCIDDFCRMMEDSGVAVQKRVIRSYTALYPQVLMHLYANPFLELWKRACNLKLKIVSFLQIQNDGVLEYAIRFMHVVILIQLERDKSVPATMPSDKLSLDSCPDNHPFLGKDELRMEADLLIKEYLNIISSPTSRLGPLTAIVGGLVGLCIARPQLQILIGKPLLEITQNLPSGLNSMEKESFVRCIRNFFISVYSKIPTSSPSSKAFKEAAVGLGSKLTDLLKFQKTGKLAQPSIQPPIQEYCEDMPAHNVDIRSFSLEQIANIITYALGSTPNKKWEQALKTLSSSIPSNAQPSTVEPGESPLGSQAMETEPPVSTVRDTSLVGKDNMMVDDIDITLKRVMESPEIDGESLFLELLKNVINAERYFLGDRAQSLSSDFEFQSIEDADKRKSLGALRLGWQLMVSKLSVAPLISLEKRKMLNSNSIAEYKTKICEVLVSFFFEDLKSRLELLILWLNHMWLFEKREKKKIAASKQDEVVGGYFYWVHYMLDKFCAKLSPNDRVLTKFLVEIPEISDKIINTIAEKCCEQKNRTELGLFILQALTSLRPSVRDTCLKRLLEYAIRCEKHIRIPAIITCKRLYIGNSTLAAEIEEFALKSVFLLLEEHPPSEKQGDSSSEQGLGESQCTPPVEDYIKERVIARSELYFVLCSVKQELSAEVFKMFKDFSPEVQKGIAIALDPLIKSLSSQPGRLMDLVKTFPGEANFIAELARNAIRNREKSALQ